LEVKIDRKEDSRVEIEVTIPAADIKKKIDDKLQEYRKTVDIKGFRKGKAPMAQVRNIVGKAVQQEVLDTLVSESYVTAITDNDLTPIDQGEIQKLEFEPGEDMVFVALIPVEPEIEIDQYKGIEVEEPEVEMDESRIDETLERIRRDFSSWTPVDEAAVDGSQLVVDLQENDSLGLPIKESRYTNLQIVLGEKTYGEDFDKQMIGVKAEENRNVTISDPREESEEGTPKTEYFTVEVKEIKKLDLLPMDDELAKEVPPGYETLDELRDKIRADLSDMMNQDRARQLNDRLIEKVTELNAVEVPQQMIDLQLENLIERTRQGSENPVDENVIKEQYADQMKSSAHWYLLKKAIIRAEDLSVSDEDLEMELGRLAQQRGTTPEVLRPQLLSDEHKDEFRGQALDNKVMSLLRENAIMVKPGKGKKKTAGKSGAKED
jgi:trigger factor